MDMTRDSAEYHGEPGDAAVRTVRPRATHRAAHGGSSPPASVGRRDEPGRRHTVGRRRPTVGLRRPARGAARRAGLGMDQAALIALHVVQPARCRRDHFAVAPFDTRHGASLDGLYAAQVAVGVLGILFVTGEYATGMIRSSFTAVPVARGRARRRRPRCSRRGLRRQSCCGGRRHSSSARLCGQPGPRSAAHAGSATGHHRGRGVPDGARPAGGRARASLSGAPPVPSPPCSASCSRRRCWPCSCPTRSRPPGPAAALQRADPGDHDQRDARRITSARGRASP